MSAATEREAILAPSVPAGMAAHHKTAFVVLAAILVAAPFLVYPVFAMKVLCFALFASAFNLLLGYGGLLSFGHAAYFGMASYVSAYAAKEWGLTPELAILSGTLVAALLGLAIGALAIRRQGIYFAMVTLAFAQMVYFFSLQAPFTGGEDGIQAVPRGKLFGVIDLAGHAPIDVGERGQLKDDRLGRAGEAGEAGGEHEDHELVVAGAIAERDGARLVLADRLQHLAEGRVDDAVDDEHAAKKDRRDKPVEGEVVGEVD